MIDIPAINNTYSAWLKQDGDKPEGVGWDNVSQKLLFDRTLSELSDRGTLLDFGCGTGHFGEYLQKEKKEIVYVGVDINPISVATAQNKGLTVYHGTIDHGVDMPRFDYVIALGTFHYFDIHCDNLKGALRQYIQLLLPITKKKLIFTAMDKNDKNYASISAKQLRSLAKKMKIEKINGMFFCVIGV